MLSRKPLTLLACLLASMAISACSGQGSQTSTTTSGASAGGNAATVTLVGAGSTFDNPFFSRAFYQYQQTHPNVAVNYQSIGSGGGIRQFTARTVDFGATDVPMTSKELAAMPAGKPIIELPITLGGVAIAYNVPGAPAHLKLSPSIIADIFLGKITDWNDQRIAALNPGANLRSLPIAVVHRADGSGTTYIFTDYLSSVSSEWSTKVGKGKTVAWPAPSAIGAKGTEGVAGQLRSTPGAIGYIELAYALQNQIAYASVQNKAGQYVLPSIDSVAAAAAAKPNVSAKDFSIVNEGGAQSYPIAGYSWVLLYRQYPDSAKQQALKDLFAYMLGDGQSLAKSIDYTPLPTAISKLGVSSVAQLGSP